MAETSRQVRVLVTANTCFYLYNFRRDVLLAMIERGWEVLIAAPTDRYQIRLTELGCSVVPLEFKTVNTSPIQLIQLFVRYQSLFQEFQPDLLLAFTIKPNIFGSLAASNSEIPVINTIPGLGSLYIEPDWRTRLVNQLYRRALRPSKAVFFQNQDDLNQFVGLGLVKANVTHKLDSGGIDTEHFYSSSNVGHGQRFLFIARLLRYKGLPDLVEAMRRVQATHPSAELHVVGDPALDSPGAIPELELAAWHKAGLIQLSPGVEDVRPFFEACDCVVLPSYYREGVPRVLLEALAMGRPVITTDVVGCREAVTAGEQGWLVPPRDVEALSNAMIEFLNSNVQRRTAMSLACRARAQTQFDVKRVVARYLKVIDSVLDLSQNETPCAA